MVNFLPSEAGTQLMLSETAAGDLTSLHGGVLLAVWALLPLLAGVTYTELGQRRGEHVASKGTK